MPSDYGMGCIDDQPIYIKFHSKFCFIFGILEYIFFSVISFDVSRPEQKVFSAIRVHFYRQSRKCFWELIQVRSDSHFEWKMELGTYYILCPKSSRLVANTNLLESIWNVLALCSFLSTHFVLINVSKFACIFISLLLRTTFVLTVDSYAQCSECTSIVLVLAYSALGSSHR